MYRRKFLESALGRSALTLAATVAWTAFRPAGREFVVPTLNGPVRVVSLVPASSLIAEAHAQGYGYGYSMGYAQMVAYQQAHAAWLRRLQQLQMQMAWIHHQQIQALQAQLANYSQYRISETPRPWESIRSIYGVAEGSTQDVMFGANEQSQPVAISNTLGAASKIFQKVSERFDEREAERAVGPQSNEKPVMIALPDGNALPGSAYRTRNGVLGLTNNKVQDTRTGKSGKLAKYMLGSDGNQYEII